MAIQLNADGSPVLDANGNPVQIPDAAPAQPAPVAAPGPAPVAPPPVPPRNNTYMGPNIGSPNATPQQFFQDNQFLQGNHSFVSPPTPDQAAGAAGRVAVGTGAESNQAALGRLRSVDAPGSMTIGVNNAPAPDPADEIMALAQKMGVPLKTATEAVKAQQQFQALRGYKADVERGILTEAQAMAKWKPFLPQSGGMTPYQEAQTKMRKEQLDQQADKANRVVPPKDTPAEILQFKVLLGKERQAEIDKDPKAANAARWEKAQFMKEHPNFGKPAGGAAPMTATGTTPAPMAGRPPMPGAAPAPAPMAAPAPGRPPVAAPAPAAQGKPVKDKNGKTWVYTGTAADPKTDKNPAHWKSE